MAWLHYLEGLGLSPCLADDMGLGKTIQVIARLLHERAGERRRAANLADRADLGAGELAQGDRALRAELRALVHQGRTRLKQAELRGGLPGAGCGAYLLRAGAAGREAAAGACTGGGWWWTRRRISRIRRRRRRGPSEAARARIGVALTGTPVENRLRDLWSIFNFLNPGYLGKEAQFRKSFELPIQKRERRRRARRPSRGWSSRSSCAALKTDKRIIDDLPDKIEQKLYCKLDPRAGLALRGGGQGRRRADRRRPRAWNAEA